MGAETKQYTVEVKFTLDLKDIEPESTIRWRVNEMLAALERKDDARIVLLHHVNVKEIG